MEIFDLMSETNNNEVVFFEEPTVNLRSIIAINNTVLGPALATCRIHDFKSIEKASRIALSMAYYNTYRSALLKRNLGGGSVVLCGDSKKIKNEMYLRTLGIFINKLRGKLYLAQGSGITHKDMLDIKRESDFLLGINEKYTKFGTTPITAIAKGMIWGLKAALKEKYNSENISGLTIAVQGVGEVGSNFVKELLKHESKIIITDIIYDKIKVIQDQVPNIMVVKPHDIYRQKCDVFVSCAFNNILKEEDLEQLDCKILTGSINSILKDERLEKIVIKKNILYIPGFIINGGEIIQLSNEFDKKDPSIVENELSDIYYTTRMLINKSKEQKKTINNVALETAHEYIRSVAAIKQLK